MVYPFIEKVEVLGIDLKFDINRGGRVIIILDFGLGQGRLAMGAPQDRFFAAINASGGDKLPKFLGDNRFIIIIHSEIRLLPSSQDAQSLEFVPLNINVLIGVVTAGLAYL